MRIKQKQKQKKITKKNSVKRAILLQFESATAITKEDST